MIKVVVGDGFEPPNSERADLQSAAFSHFATLPDKKWRMTGSNRRPSACKADALPTELILHFKEKPGNFLLSHIVLPSALKCLTSVFGMGTGVSTLPSSPDLFFEN